ncbi:MAG: hypothetical protein DBX00_03795 [Verrucomicrobia bacterium]|nr:MAG: hypothetical protein DBX00_03795 [Verrucomicrobiota bacterium]
MLNLVLKSTSKIPVCGAVGLTEGRRNRLLFKREKRQEGKGKQFSMAGQYAGLNCALELVSSSLIRVCDGAPERGQPESFRRNPAGKNDFLPGNHSRTCPGGSGHLFD